MNNNRFLQKLIATIAKTNTDEDKWAYNNPCDNQSERAVTTPSYLMANGQ